MDTPNSETPKKSRWQSFLLVVQSPYDFLTHWSLKSPVLTLLAVVFVLQPIVSTSIDLLKEVASVREDLDPANRPVTRAEFDLLNQKIDFMQSLIVANINDIKDNKHAISGKPVVTPQVQTDAAASAPINAVQSKLTDLEQKLDTEYRKAKKK